MSSFKSTHPSPSSLPFLSNRCPSVQMARPSGHHAAPACEVCQASPHACSRLAANCKLLRSCPGRCLHAAQPSPWCRTNMCLSQSSSYSLSPNCKLHGNGAPRLKHARAHQKQARVRQCTDSPACGSPSIVHASGPNSLKKSTLKQKNVGLEGDTTKFRCVSDACRHLRHDLGRFTDCTPPNLLPETDELRPGGRHSNESFGTWAWTMENLMAQVAPII